MQQSVSGSQADFTVPTFFCSRTTLVHFFSKRPSYFLLVAASNVSPMLISSLSAAAVLVRFLEVRYAIIDLWLFMLALLQHLGRGYLQLLGLPRRENLGHGDSTRVILYMNVRVDQIWDPEAARLAADVEGLRNLVLTLWRLRRGNVSFVRAANEKVAADVRILIRQADCRVCNCGGPTCISMSFECGEECHGGGDRLVPIKKCAPESILAPHVSLHPPTAKIPLGTTTRPTTTLSAVTRDTWLISPHVLF